MAYVQLSGAGHYVPVFPDIAEPPAFGSQLLIDASGEKIAFCGRAWWAGRSGTKAIRRVGFLFGAVTKAGGSGLTISLQDVDLTSGPPVRPDGTQDQTVAVANGDVSFATDTWYRSGALSADRTVAMGEMLSVVVEYDGSGRQGADSVILKGLSSNSSGHKHQSSAVLFTSSWAAQVIVPNVVLEFSDGTFGTLAGSFPCSALGTLAYNLASATDEYCLEGQFPFPCKVDGADIFLLGGSTVDVDIVAYDGVTAITNGTRSIDGNTFVGTAGRRSEITFDAELTFARNTTYRLAIKPTTGNNITIYYFDVANSDHLGLHPGGAAFFLNGRADLGSWGAGTNTRRIFAGWRISSLDDGASSGGLKSQRHMTGGLV